MECNPVLTQVKTPDFYFFWSREILFPTSMWKSHEKGWDPSGCMGRLFDYFAVQTQQVVLKAFLSLISLQGLSRVLLLFFSSSRLIYQKLKLSLICRSEDYRFPFVKLGTSDFSHVTVIGTNLPWICNILKWKYFYFWSLLHFVAVSPTVHLCCYLHFSILKFPLDSSCYEKKCTVTP